MFVIENFHLSKGWTDGKVERSQKNGGFVLDRPVALCENPDPRRAKVVKLVDTLG